MPAVWPVVVAVTVAARVTWTGSGFSRVDLGGWSDAELDMVGRRCWKLRRFDGRLLGLVNGYAVEMYRGLAMCCLLVVELIDYFEQRSTKSD
jgi:hypothetical protein